MDTFTCSRCRSTTDEATGYTYRTGTAEYRTCPPCAQVWARKFPGLAKFPLVRLALLALCYIAAPAPMAEEPKKETKATACLENRHHMEEQYVRLIDAEGKKHRYLAYAIGEGTDTEWADFEKSRRMVALDDSLKLTVKQGYDLHGDFMLANLGVITHCTEKKRGGFPKL